MTSLLEAAPAKLNLFLHLTGRRPDGYHTLESLMAFTQAGDLLRASPCDELIVESAGAFAGALPGRWQDNFISRAAQALRRECGVQSGARLSLEKHLPVASGIGGGSADAAAALRLLSRLWAVPLPKERLHRLALSLGSDVPACLMQRAARATGVGEVLQPVALPAPLHAVLLNPGVALSTAEVYGRVRQPQWRGPVEDWPRFETAQALAQWLRPLHNDLQPAAAQMAPVIADALAALAAQPGCLLSRMSGSGATCFGLFASAAQAGAAAAAIQHPGWWVQATRIKECNADEA